MKILLRLVLVISVVTVSQSIMAQKTLKMAHINMEKLIQSMPEYDSLTVTIQKEAKALEAELESLQVEFRRKFEDYTTNRDKWTELVRQSREEELSTMSQNVEKFRTTAEQSVQQEQARLLQPILEKANKAVDEVVKEQGITYVLNEATIISKSADSHDILPLVQKKLGIKSSN
ncbi:MAG: OmpH family outer membrane protein [Bacteroidales bacterium]|jgi:outer membrane protein|nr:OmpH family outer membrane protein [Bacteroidales bacterium]